MRALALGLLALVGCASAPAGTTAPPLPAPVAAPRPPPPVPHADFEHLRRYHSYYRVLALGEHCHHFVVFYDHYELVHALYEVPMAPGAPLRASGGSFGMITERPDPEPIPAAVAPMAEAVRADLLRREPGAKAPQILYLGAFRTLEVEEILVREAGAKRDDLHSFRLTLAASEDLGTILGRARYHMGSGGTLRLDDPSERLDVPTWIDGGLGLLGRGQLWKRFQTPSSFAPEVRARFDAATLAAARRLRDGQPGLALSALASEQDQRLLPADLETRRPFIFYVNGVESGRRQNTATTWIHPVRAFGGEERTEMRLSVATAIHGDQRFEAEVRLRGAPLPEGAKGEIELPLTIDYRVSATRGKPFEGTLTAPARVVVDGERVHFLAFLGAIPQHDFPGVGEYSAFEAHLGFFGED